MEGLRVSVVQDILGCIIDVTSSYVFYLLYYFDTQVVIIPVILLLFKRINKVN